MVVHSLNVFPVPSVKVPQNVVLIARQKPYKINLRRCVSCQEGDQPVFCLRLTPTAAATRAHLTSDGWLTVTLNQPCSDPLSLFVEIYGKGGIVAAEFSATVIAAVA